MLIAILPLVILTGHSILYWRGKMASNGEVRYMLTVATFWALLGARGWAWIFDSLRWQRPLRWAGVAALSPMVINYFYPVLPLQSQPDWIRAGQFADWYRAGDYDKKYPYLAASHPGIFYALDLCPSDRTRTRDWRKDVLDPVPAGTLLGLRRLLWVVQRRPESLAVARRAGARRLDETANAIQRANSAGGIGKCS